MLYVKFGFKLNKLLAFKDFRDFLNIIGLGKRGREKGWDLPMCPSTMNFQPLIH